MNVSGAEIVARVLKAEGVRFLFGIPGTHNIELYDHLVEVEEIRPILVTDEQSAAFMADGVARASGQLAAVNLVPGAGLTHALSGIAECFLDQIPLLVLLCGIRRDTGKAFQLHDIDQAAILKPVSKKVLQPTTHAELSIALLQACRLAKEPPCGPAAVEVPANLYLLRGEVTDEFVGPGKSPPQQISEDRIVSIIETLNRSRSIAIYAGLGAQEATDQLVEVAEKLDAVVFTTISAKGIFPENHPRWGWNTMGRAAPPEIRRLEQDCDCLLAIGARFGEVATASYGFAPPKTLIHIDMDPAVFHRNYPATHTLIADARELLKALLDSRLLRNKRSDLDKIQKLIEAHQQVRQKQHESGHSNLVHPALLLDQIRHTCGPETVYVADSGNGTFLAMEHLRLTRPHSFLAPVDYSCMGYSIPAAIGAKLSEPQRPVAALVGDGAFLMTGLELATAVAYRAGILVFLLRDRELSQIAQFQEASFSRKSCTELADYNAEDIAKGVGAEYLSMQRNQDVEWVVEKALDLTRNGTPALVEVSIDYSIPTYFSKGVVMTNFLRFPWKDRIRLISRVLKRKLTQ